MTSNRLFIPFPRYQILSVATFLALCLCGLIKDIEFLRQFKITGDPSLFLPNISPKVFHNATADHSQSLSIAWLASFPNSGTSYTLQVVRKVSQTRVATNYASLRADRHSISPTGPFWSDELTASYKNPIEYVLTKTHCGAVCVDCPPEKYLRMMHEFRILCFTGEQLVMEDGKRTIRHVMYAPSRVKKVVHLYRSPLDNAVARFRYETNNNRSASGFPNTRDGFRDYCEQLNQRYARAEVDGRFLNKSIWALLRNVPCRIEFFRYVEWHNLAAATFQDMGLDVMALHYDSYETHLNQTIDSLLSFLNLDRQSAPVAFVPGKSYSHFFTEEEHEAIATALRVLALDSVWHNIKGYVKNR